MRFAASAGAHTSGQWLASRLTESGAERPAYRLAGVLRPEPFASRGGARWIGAVGRGQPHEPEGGRAASQLARAHDSRGEQWSGSRERTLSILSVGVVARYSRAAWHARGWSRSRSNSNSTSF